jgi:hypothetical protein
MKYSRATRLLTLGSASIDTTRTNVAVLSVGPSGVTVRHQSRQNLTFPRHGPPPPGSVDLLRFQPEVGAAVRALLDRSPELRALIAAPPP